MPLSDIVTVTIQATAANPSTPNFGLPLIAAYHTHYPDRSRLYSSLAAMVSDGFAVTEPAYLAAAAVFSQNPSVTGLKIGRRALPPTQTLSLACLTSTTGVVYSFSVAGHAVSY